MPQPNQRHHLDNIKHKGFATADESAQASVLQTCRKPRVRKGAEETDQRGAWKVPYYIRGAVEFHIRIDIRTGFPITDDESMSQLRDLCGGKRRGWRVRR